MPYVQNIYLHNRFKIYKDPNGFDCLQIPSASRGVAGEFEIQATNDMGMAASKCNIKVNSECIIMDWREGVL